MLPRDGGRTIRGRNSRPLQGRIALVAAPLDEAFLTLSRLYRFYGLDLAIVLALGLAVLCDWMPPLPAWPFPPGAGWVGLGDISSNPATQVWAPLPTFRILALYLGLPLVLAVSWFRFGHRAPTGLPQDRCWESRGNWPFYRGLLFAATWIALVWRLGLLLTIHLDTVSDANFFTRSLWLGYLLPFLMPIASLAFGLASFRRRNSQKA